MWRNKEETDQVDTHKQTMQDFMYDRSGKWKERKTFRIEYTENIANEKVFVSIIWINPLSFLDSALTPKANDQKQYIEVNYENKNSIYGWKDWLSRQYIRFDVYNA